MKKRLLITVLTVGGVLLVPSVAHAHPFNPPNGGAGGTPMNSLQAQENALDNLFNAVEVSGGAALNAALRNPTCPEHEVGPHPPGNP